MIVQLHVSQVCAARDEEFYIVWKVLTYMIHMMLYYIQCTIESGRTRSACSLLTISSCSVSVRSLIVIILLYYIIDCILDF